MTQQTRATNKAAFETGDAPTESDYINLIDSFLSLADTSAQTVTSGIILSGTLGIGGKLSAQSISANTLTVGSAITVPAMTVTSVLSASSAVFGNLTAGEMTITGVVSASSAVLGNLTAGAVTITGVVSASAGAFGAVTVAAIASIAQAHLMQITINTDATATVSGAASANRYVEVTVSGAQYWMPLYAQ